MAHLLGYSKWIWISSKTPVWSRAVYTGQFMNFGWLSGQNNHIPPHNPQFVLPYDSGHTIILLSRVQEFQLPPNRTKPCQLDDKHPHSSPWAVEHDLEEREGDGGEGLAENPADVVLALRAGEGMDDGSRGTVIWENEKRERAKLTREENKGRGKENTHD